MHLLLFFFIFNKERLNVYKKKNKRFLFLDKEWLN